MDNLPPVKMLITFFNVYQGFQKHFKRLDLDGDGHISINDIKTHFKNMGMRVTARNLDDLIYEVDQNRNGQVEFEEFVSVNETSLTFQLWWKVTAPLLQFSPPLLSLLPFLQLMHRMKKGGSTNWKKLLDFTQPRDERQGTVGRAISRSTLRFLGATPAHEFEHDQQWQNYSFFQRVDQPPAPTRSRSTRDILQSLNPFARQGAEEEDDGAPGPSNRAHHANPTPASMRSRNLMEVRVLKEDDDLDAADVMAFRFLPLSHSIFPSDFVSLSPLVRLEFRVLHRQ